MDLASIHTVPAHGPTRLGMHSLEGFGKTTLAAAFPTPVFIASERGFPRDLPVRPSSFPAPKRWADIFEAIDNLKTQRHRFRTLVFDTIDWLEPLIHVYVCERDSGRKTEMNKNGTKLESIEDYGYHKGYVAAAEEFRRMLVALDDLQEATGMHVVMLAHSAVKGVTNPAGDNYDRWQPKMDARISRLVVEWSETFLFGFYEVEAAKLKDEKKAKAVSTGRRLLGAKQNALYDAKNRMGLPDVIDLGRPEDLIPYLLGEHVPAARMAEERSTGRVGMASAPESEAAAHLRHQPEPERAGVDFRRHLKEREAEGMREREAAQQRALVAAAGRSDINGKVAPPEPDEPGSRDPHQERVDAIEKAAEQLGEKYATKVRKWLHQAGDDLDKIESIADEVDAQVRKQLAT